MPRDYKHRVPGTLRRSGRRRRNAWYWALPAVLAGAAAIAVFKFSADEEPAAEPTPSASTETPANVAGPGSSQDAKEPNVSADSKKEMAAIAVKDKKARDAKQKKPASTEKVPVVEMPEPRFTFYKILPEKEVIVSESEIRHLAREEKSGKGEGGAGGYLIQAGSFRTQEEAEKMKAQLAAAKVKARMEKVIIDNATWYRVKIGPYKSLMDAEKTRAYLRKNKVDSVLQQTKP